MGYLYTLDDIREGRTPTEEDFLTMGAIVEAALREEHFLASSLFGSLPRGDWNRRSDIDVMAVANSANHERAAAHIADLQRQAAERHIYLSAHLHTVAEARRGDHPFDSTHRMTMRELAAAGLTKGYPHQWFWAPGQEVRPDIFDRLCRVLRATSKQAHKFKSVRTQRKLEQWIRENWAVGSRPLRLYVGFIRWLTWWKLQHPFPDGKMQVLSSFLADPEFLPFHDEVRAMHGIDRLYDDIIDAARDGRINEGRYYDTVHEMVSTSFRTSVSMLSRAVGFVGTTGLSDHANMVAA